VSVFSFIIELFSFTIVRAMRCSCIEGKNDIWYQNKYKKCL